MTPSAAPPFGPRRFVFPALLVAVFTVSAGYGLVLPQIPSLVRGAPGGHIDDVAFHAGGLTGLYMLAVAVFAPLWGRLSDRIGRKPVLLAGLVGFALSMLMFAAARTLAQLYLERMLSGLFAAAVAPVAAAYVADLAPTDQWRAHRLARLNMAAIAGFVLGPIFSAAVAAAGKITSPLAAPLVATGALALGAAALLARISTAPSAPAGATQLGRSASASSAVVLLGLSFAVAFAVGTFEVGLAARSTEANARELAVMFSVCSLVMFGAQAAVFSPLTRAERTSKLLGPGFLLIAIALVLAPRVSGFAPALAVVGLLAASAGATSPVLAYWQSIVSGRRQGSGLGDQTALASLGQALGSATGGVLLGSRLADPFLIAAAVALTAALVGALAAPRLSSAVPSRAPSKASARL
ncbi:MFS transporter [Phenylobacterium soli]|uniref:MFS transporter n=1 Tax=Phenylobacterium soli TaxID=2170551 RepID=UPI001402D54A|nr:MFS transporter [Phenylobacterium soli]